MRKEWESHTLELARILDGCVGQGAGTCRPDGTWRKGLTPQKKKLMTCEEKPLWEILPSLLLGQKITFRWPKKKPTVSALLIYSDPSGWWLWYGVNVNRDMRMQWSALAFVNLHAAKVIVEASFKFWHIPSVGAPIPPLFPFLLEDRILCAE